MEDSVMKLLTKLKKILFTRRALIWKIEFFNLKIVKHQSLFMIRANYRIKVSRSLIVLAFLFDESEGAEIVQPPRRLGNPGQFLHKLR